MSEVSIQQQEKVPVSVIVLILVLVVANIAMGVLTVRLIIILKIMLKHYAA
ncbi:hypothetical protein Tfer_2150 [Thermincola ferriacetica]|uniref:Uncharacterized protein n=1 Tax=Thermincola ferriacetica TaxID=281456 RepID=A0A0L6W296_9FIRM|nr:hypothetical protein [Thermincola ferriacetica]KNZ69204.1 hypothetical protein Tfer_2150 [Thermincola ferriacetica]